MLTLDLRDFERKAKEIGDRSRTISACSASASGILNARLLRLPELPAIIEAPKARDSDNTITHKECPGGPMDFVGANSPTDLASRPKRISVTTAIVLCDFEETRAARLPARPPAPASPVKPVPRQVAQLPLFGEAA